MYCNHNIPKLSANASSLKHQQCETESIRTLHALLDGGVSGDKLGLWYFLYFDFKARLSNIWKI